MLGGPWRGPGQDGAGKAPKAVHGRPFHATACSHTRTAVGKALCEHPVVSSIHLTGSADTYNAIVWGGRDVPVRGC